MKVANVEYHGRVRNQRHRGPSGTLYRFNGDECVVESMMDARHFEDKNNFEVSYTARGQLMSLVQGEVDDLQEAIEDIDYNIKRSMASSLDIETESQEESVLEEALVETAEELRKQMEN